MTPVSPRSVTDVSKVTRINHQHHFKWQAQYLSRLGGMRVPPRNINDIYVREGLIMKFRKRLCNHII